MTLIRGSDAAVPRMTVNYGGFAIDESNGCILCTGYDTQDTPTDGSFYCEFRVRLTDRRSTGFTPSDDAAFAALIANVEQQLRIPRQKLLVAIEGQPFRTWDFEIANQTAFLIQPELELKEGNCRDYRYGFRVRCQFPGNVPGNGTRRDSLTTRSSNLQARRTCTIRGQWTSGPEAGALLQFLNQGEQFFVGQLPPNFTDQYGNSGAWITASEDPPFNDEASIIDVTRVYWEVFGGRRESASKTITTLNNRRVFTCPSVWTGTSATDGFNGFTALQNYLDGGDGFYDAALPEPVPGGEWVLVDEEPDYNDQNSILTVVRTYHECVDGLRDYSVRVTTNANGTRQLVVSGVYYDDGNGARQNYLDGIDAFTKKILTDEGFSRYESHSVPKVTGYGVTGKEYVFTHTYNELAYPQGPGGWDDANVVFETLNVEVDKPKDPQSIGSAFSLTRPMTGNALFVATIDIASAGGDDPATLWQTSGGLRDHVRSAIIAKLGADVRSIDVTDEKVNVGLSANQLVGRLEFIVTGGSVLSCRITQTLTQVPSRDFAPEGDGTLFSYFPYRDSAEKLLHREAIFEYVVGTQPPEPFPVGDTTVSGFGFIDTGVAPQDSIDAQNATGELSLGAGWFIDRRSPAPFATTSFATTRGDGFQTVGARRVEDWRWVENLLPGMSLDS